MLERLTAFFGNPAGYHTPLPEADAQHAMGALLVRAAKADHTYLVEEIAMIDKILTQRHGINPVAAAKMRATILEKAIGTEEKEATLLAHWQVVYSDGIIHDEEDEVLHQIEAVLGVGPERAKELQAQAQI